MTTDSTFIGKARTAWAGAAPDWVTALAEEADRTSGRAAAQRIGYSEGVVSTVIRAKYPGDLATVAERVRGALMGHTVECPVWGEIGRDLCLSEQALPFQATSSARAQCFRACRSGCPHSRLTNEAASTAGKDAP